MESLSTLNFPVIRGLQAGREYYVTMWTLRMLKQISIFDEGELPPELRAQRIINKARIPEIAGYILDNPKDYIFSAITASIDSEVEFEPMPGKTGENKLGLLKVPMDAKFIINDGQHRRAAILSAMEQKPELGSETIAVVFFLDIGLSRSQQMFADLNRYAIRPSRSLGLLYDHRNDKAKLARLVIMKSDMFRDIVDLEKSSLAPRSRKLFTLSAFYNACADLVQDVATGANTYGHRFQTTSGNPARAMFAAIAAPIVPIPQNPTRGWLIPFVLPVVPSPAPASGRGARWWSGSDAA